MVGKIKIFVQINVVLYPEIILNYHIFILIFHLERKFIIGKCTLLKQKHRCHCFLFGFCLLKSVTVKQKK